MTAAPTLAAMVLGSRGGPRLARALESVAWAGERALLDPLGRLDDERLPAGVLRTRTGAEGLSAPWLLLLEEREVVSPVLAAAIMAAIVADAAAGWAIPQELHAGGAVFRLPGAPVRLVRRPGARLRFRGGLVPELRPAHGPIRRLTGALVTCGPDSLAGAVVELDADATALAGLLGARRLRPRLWHLVLPPVAGAGRALASRAGRPALATRWTLAVFAGVRALVAYAKLWEMHRLEASRTR
jgi:hypothetical protein